MARTMVSCSSAEFDLPTARTSAASDDRQPDYRRIIIAELAILVDFRGPFQNLRPLAGGPFSPWPISRLDILRAEADGPRNQTIITVHKILDEHFGRHADHMQG